MANDKNALSGTIFDEAGYDEMQKSENHEIGYRLFKAMFFVVLAAALILTMVCGNANDLWGMAFSLALFAVVFVFYIIYAYMTAKKGIMNPKFAKGWSAKWVIPVYFILEVFEAVQIFRRSEYELSDIAFIIQWQIIIISCISMSLCAMKNNRVLKAQLEENETDG